MAIHPSRREQGVVAAVGVSLLPRFQLSPLSTTSECRAGYLDIGKCRGGLRGGLSPQPTVRSAGRIAENVAKCRCRCHGERC